MIRFRRDANDGGDHGGCEGRGVSEAGEGWSDNQIIDALATSASMVYRVRKQLEEGLEYVLRRKLRAVPPVPRFSMARRKPS